MTRLRTLAAPLLCALFLAPAAAAQEELHDEIRVSPPGGAENVPLNARLFVSDLRGNFSATLTPPDAATLPVSLSEGSWQEGFTLPGLEPSGQHTLHYGPVANATYASSFNTRDFVDEEPPLLEPDVLVNVASGQCDEGACPLGGQRYLAGISLATADDESGIAFYSVYERGDDDAVTLVRRQFGGYNWAPPSPIAEVTAPFFEGESKVFLVTATDYAGNESEPTNDIPVTASDAGGCSCSASSAGQNAMTLAWALIGLLALSRRRRLTLRVRELSHELETPVRP